MGEDARIAMPTTDKSVGIKQVENGFIVSVGCKTFVSQDWNAVSEGLKLYFENPEEAKKKYCK